jgi:hypothetical protein
MNAKIEVSGRVTQSLRIPESADVAFRVCRETGSAQLDPPTLEKASVPEPYDPVYDPVLEVGDVEFLAEARAIVEVIKQGLGRRLANPVEEGETIRFQ